ncbi:MAG TPA: YrdB family protein [Thermomicrobiaceae bacterium]|nr:YrdB family protein [Thermomicrobiaceae bacterium]
MQTVKLANLGLRFLLELAALVAFADWGVHVGGDAAGKAALGVGLPLLVAVVWGAFIAPRSLVAVPARARAALGLVVLLAAAAALAAAGQPIPGIAFGIIVVVNAALLLLWKQ